MGGWTTSSGNPMGLAPGTSAWGGGTGTIGGYAYGNPTQPTAPRPVTAAPVMSAPRPANYGLPASAGATPSGNFNFSAANFAMPGQVSYTPQAFNTSVQENPQIAALQSQMASYRGGLAAGNDADAQLALGRQRDIASGMAKEGLQGAIDRGFGSESGYAQQRRLKGLDAGQSAMAGLNAQLTSDARKQQLAALQGEGNLAQAQAGITAQQQNFNLEQWRAQDSAAQAAAQLQAQQQQNAFSNQMQLAGFNANQQQNQFSNQMALANMYTGF